MASQEPVVRVGVAAIIKNVQGKMVMGVRKGFGAGKWQFPGGHLEMGESYFAGAERETLEETGLHVRAEKMIAVTNDLFSESKHYITIFVACRRVDEKQEPECEGWVWKDWSDVKEMLNGEDGENKFFLPINNLLNEHPNIEEIA
ncbi:NUDIX hydrolase domain-like protein [Bombardia bombarda]|uniref:NUDIX hydrolase domain-like protein n=1 Tax=Bombardia bombarda TaxID=252184 RepID=A0AA39X0A8_9PEZI|nr:NUDIX hydrolase domain-like protein [Bombardia bombarda]